MNSGSVKNNTAMTIIGFLLFIIGFLALAFSLVGINFTFLGFLEKAGGTFALVIKLLMTFGGIILVYVSRMDRSV